MNIPEHLRYPKTFNQKKWTTYLGRGLNYDEIKIIRKAQLENSMNKKMKYLYNVCNELNLYVPLLTKLNGNCLFESLVYNGIGNDVYDLRKGFAHIMVLLKDYKYLIPNVDLTLNEMHAFGNDIDYVYTEIDDVKHLYKYSYEIMCHDLANLYSWSKLPTELLLRAMSYLFKIKFEIVHNDNGHVTEIYAPNDIENDTDYEYKIIKLGLLGESHYVPLEDINNDDLISPIYYTKSKNKFFKWGHNVESKIYDEYISHCVSTSKMLEDNNNSKMLEDIDIDKITNITD